jgi:hypothetical protein
MSCPKIHRIWFGFVLNLKILDQPILNFKDWIINSILNLKEESITQIASITYNIWQARNQSIFENRDIPEVDIIQRSERCVYDFLQSRFEDPDAALGG